MKELISERQEVCSICTYFIDNKCNMCGCPTMGIIEKIDSRCPMNKWIDGWGNEIIKVQDSVVDMPNVEITYFDDIDNEFFKSFDYDSTIVFTNDEDSKRYFRRINMMINIYSQ